MKTGDGGNCKPAVDAVFRRHNASLESQKSSYDPDSIMHYCTIGELTIIISTTSS